MRLIILYVFFLGAISSLFSQERAWFYLIAKDTLIQPEFKKINDQLIYIGKDEQLKKIFGDYIVFEFKKTLRKAKKKNLKRTFFVISNEGKLLQDLLNNTSHLFEFGEFITGEDKKIYEPNDYGLTSTIGENLGLQANLDYLDFLGAPKAWYYTTGSPDVIIGISDGSVDTTNTDFKGKTKQFRKSNFAKGHGNSQSGSAAAQGDNGYGITGLCYDCSIYGTSYGDFRKFDQLLELSKAGVKVINCSWIGRVYYEKAQSVIDEMFENGTIIVASAGNRSWKDTKGKLKYYPSSYNHVISVSSVMHRYEDVYENIGYEEKNGNPFASNIRGYVGRSVGFKNNDITKSHHIWPISTAILNSEVDILAPTVGLFIYSKFIFNGEIIYNAYETTSGASPFVSGTIGLMFSLSPCLPVDEVESILKITATNIDDIEANKPYYGNYGAGSLNTGRAVKMVYDMFSPNEIMYIENQKFSRWDFKLTSYSKEVHIRNQKFTDNATLLIKAKNRIVIGRNTVLRPNIDGKIHLIIDPTLEKQCDLELREGF